jgi:membrane protein
VERDLPTVTALTATLVEWRWVPATLAAAPLAVVRFFRHLGAQWAATLAYYTIFALVPVLAAVFALVKALGFHRELTPYLVNTVGAGSPKVAAQIIAFIDQTNVAPLGVLGAIGALLGIFGILVNAELCFNAIWGEVPGRPWWRKLQAFGKVVVVAPALLLSALALTAVFRRGSRAYVFLDSFYVGDLVLLVLTLLPYGLLWSAFTLLYTRLPNTAVRPRSAVVGAVVAGTLWQLLQATYMSFVIRVVRYSAVYGALWQLPILLVWLYVAWVVILFGAEVCRAHQEVSAERVSRRLPAPPAPDTARDG